ncbi:GNAT family N-acetyltransferase [Lutibacter flavus]|uniref:Protein N-acetyltransferase, RimJ/RimL family n=1 Tax=Lutibacter flavus TaxID=691689 RepID=A0A238XK04_9FLAO|nr:GNAT family N-acetyltransferase [Lutibacter flavus]SNR59257.1 Protein N-acetyltransferase, RimJ/RimL family [Lutibacter flavus]
MEKYASFETERLLLKPTSKKHAPFILELLNTPKWQQYIGDRNVHSIKEAEKYIKDKITPQLEKLGFANYTVILKKDSVKIGSCGLYNREGLDGIDIGFAFLPAYEKQGYAFESAQKIIEIGIHIFNIKKLSAITVKENYASQKLLEKLGLQFIEIIKIPNDDEELLLYRLEI